MLNDLSPASSTARPRAYLIDSSIYIFRAWHVYADSIRDHEGQPVNAVAGFSDFLWQLLRYKRPGLIACAFDESQTRSFRRELLPEYKGNRPPTPPALRRQFSLCRELCTALGIPTFGSDRFEADDILASLAACLRREGYAVTVVSADKDLAQLVTAADDTWWDFARGVILDREGIRRRFGVAPEQIADLLALAGDKADNITGVPGLGSKLAARLLHKYASLEHILDDLEGVARMKFRGAARVHALLKAHAGRLPLNKRLTSLVHDLPFDHGELGWRGVDAEALAGLCTRLNLDARLERRWQALTMA